VHMYIQLHIYTYTYVHIQVDQENPSPTLLIVANGLNEVQKVDTLKSQITSQFNHINLLLPRQFLRIVSDREEGRQGLGAASKFVYTIVVKIMLAFICFSADVLKKKCNLMYVEN